MKAVMIMILILCPLCFAGTIIPWGVCEWGQCNTPAGNDFIDIAAGWSFGAALKSDGTITQWNFSYPAPDGNFVDIEAGNSHILALDRNGYLHSWGSYNPVLHSVPAGEGWTKIAAGLSGSAAWKPDGTIEYWGYFEIDPPDMNLPIPPHTYPENGQYQDIKANIGILALKEDGTLIEWGGYSYSLNNVPSGTFKAIGCGAEHDLAIRTNGTLVAWGRNDCGQCNVPDGNDYVEVTGGMYASIARKSDGSVVIWGKTAQTGWIQMPELIETVKITSRFESFFALTSESNLTLTVNTEPAGLTVEPAAAIYYCYAGQMILLNAPRCPLCPDVWSFDYWSGDAAPKEQTQYISMTGNKIVTAHYKKLAKVCGDECHPVLQGDMNKDCYINFEDFAIYSTQWLACTHPDCD